MKMRALSFSLMLAWLAVPAAMAQQPPPYMGEALRPVLDHYDPVVLNETAIDSIRQGDLTTAWILLERAARLAPHDPRILRNLREVRAYRMGMPAPAETVEPTGRQAPGQVVPAEPPPIWPPGKP